MGKKAKLKALKSLAANLPAINRSSHEEHHLKGSEILSWGTVREIDGKPIDPEKTYLYNYPVLMVQNNARRIKRAFLSNGPEGIKSVLQNTLNIVESNQK